MLKLLIRLWHQLFGHSGVSRGQVITGRVHITAHHKAYRYRCHCGEEFWFGLTRECRGPACDGSGHLTANPPTPHIT